MAAYAYTAINSEGLELAGELQAPSRDAAREQLRVRGLLADLIEELPGSTRGADGATADGGSGAIKRSGMGKVKAKSLQVFSRQFATMIDAGLNVVAALHILEEQTDDKYLAVVVGDVRADVERGLLLSQALARHPKVFSRLYVSMVEAGEAAGILSGLFMVAAVVMLVAIVPTLAMRRRALQPGPGDDIVSADGREDAARGSAAAF